MYCSSCGSAVKPGVSYCNRCGKELNANGDSLTQLSPTLPESLVWALVAVAVGGLAMMIGLMAVMKDVLGFTNEMIIAITVLSFLLLLGAEGVIISMAFRFKRGAKVRGDRAQSKGVVTNELDAPPVRAFPEPVASVTEQTTRTLEPANSERKTD